MALPKLKLPSLKRSIYKASSLIHGLRTKLPKVPSVRGVKGFRLPKI